MSIEAIYHAVLDGDTATTQVEVKAAFEDGVSAGDILNKACIPAMTEVGRLFEEGEKFVPEMLISAHAMKTGMVLLKPHLTQQDASFAGKVVIGTVQGDLHDIGKNLVCMMLEGTGFEVIDLGTDVAPADFVTAVREEKPDIVGMSALLTTTMPAIQATVQALAEASLRDQVKVLIGGAPVNQKFADEIGADGFAPDASSASRLARELI